MGMLIGTSNESCRLAKGCEIFFVFSFFFSMLKCLMALQVIIAGAPEAAETQALMAAAHGVFAPDRVVLPIDPSNEATKVWFQQFNPEALAMIEGATKEVGYPQRYN